MTLTDLPADQRTTDTQRSHVGGDPNTERAKSRPTPIGGTPARPNVPADQVLNDAQMAFVGGDTYSEQAKSLAVSIGHPPARTQTPPAPARPTAAPRIASPVPGDPDRPRDPANRRATPTVESLGLADPLLALAADVLDDLERVRIANENRLRQLTRTEEDSDGLERGFGLPVDHPDVARLAALVEALATAEHSAELNLKRQLRKHPLGPWVKAARGVGEKQAARLLASIGDPYWNTLHDRPRKVSELWAYAGYHVLRTGRGHCDAQVQTAGSAQLPAGQSPFDTQTGSASGALTGGDSGHGNPDTQRVGAGIAATRARGQRANWSATAKMRAYLVAVSIVKAGGPYREVYDKTRTKYAGALHAVECKRCGPSGKPAPIGSPLSAGHQHARALRAVAKEVLKDLWREAKRLHEGGTP